MTELKPVYRAKCLDTRCRVDANQRAIVAALREHGASVRVLSGIGHGVPDLLFGWNGRNYLMECKSKKSFTISEMRFFEDWRGQACVVFTPAQAVKMLENMDNDVF